MKNQNQNKNQSHLMEEACNNNNSASNTVCYFGKCKDFVTIPWEMRAVEGKGWCAFAARDYMAGELVLSESPLVFIEAHAPFTAEEVKELQRRVEALNEEEQHAFRAMANVYDEEPEEVGVFLTNSFDMTGRGNSIKTKTKTSSLPSSSSSSSKTVACAIYCAIGRLNHSCTPNVQQTHIPETGEEVLYASRDIARGEEMCDCYIDLRQGLSQRQQQLQSNFRFTCTCFSCSQDSDKEEFRKEEFARKQAKQLETQMLQVAEDGDVDMAFELSVALIDLLQKQHNRAWSVRYIASAYLYSYHVAIQLHKKKYARDCLQQSHEWNVRLQGDRTPDTKRTQQLLFRKLKS